MKRKGEPITWLTCYDYPMAQIMDASGIDMMLVGDSGAMTVLGHPTTLPQTLDAQLMLTEAVLRGTTYAFVIGDMSYMTYEMSHEKAIENAGKFIAIGCDAIKLEGGARVADTVEAMVKAGLPVMGHIGLTPQSAPALGGYRVQGKTADAAKKLVEDAIALQEAGVWGMLVECVPPETMTLIHEAVDVICMSLGAGPDADGQLVVPLEVDVLRQQDVGPPSDLRGHHVADGDQVQLPQGLLRLLPGTRGPHVVQMSDRPFGRGRRQVRQ